MNYSTYGTWPGGHALIKIDSREQAQVAVYTTPYIGSGNQDQLLLTMDSPGERDTVIPAGLFRLHAPDGVHFSAKVFNHGLDEEAQRLARPVWEFESAQSTATEEA